MGRASCRRSQLAEDPVETDVTRALASVATAIAAYERTDEFAAFDSKYDRSLTGDYRMRQFDAHLFGAKVFAVEPYQLGHENQEGLDSGAWWFYQKLGFRARDPEVVALMDDELERLAREIFAIGRDGLKAAIESAIRSMSTLSSP